MPPITMPVSCVELLRAMVRIDSVTPRTSGNPLAERELGDYLAQLGEAWGLQVERLPVEGHAPNLLLTHAARSEAPWWLFDSHLDTVGVAAMSIDPFAGELRDGRLYGRGACDTKGTGAAMLWALHEAIEAGGPAANVALLFTVGEEAWQTGARSFVQHDLDRLGWRPAAVVVGEPTGMNVVRAANGYVRFQLRIIGKASHSTTPELGRNAISDMARAIVALEEEYIARLDARHPLTGRATCSINIIRGGAEHNVIPERCVVTVDHRLVPGQSTEAALANVRKVLDTRFERDLGFDYCIEDVEPAPPFGPELNGPLSEQVASVLRKADINPAIQGAPYTTNANHYAAAGLASVVLGPGDIAQAHTKDEWIALEQLELGVRGYRKLMECAP